MVTEIALLTIDPSRAAEFERAVAEASPLFRRSRGCRAMALERSIDQPGRYILRVQWDRIEDHTEGFRNSPEFRSWRELAGPFFVTPPEVDHAESAAQFF